MAKITEIFGDYIINLQLNEVKNLLKSLRVADPQSKKELLREYAEIKKINLSQDDYNFLD
jgi:hypothetical protein